MKEKKFYNELQVEAIIETVVAEYNDAVETIPDNVWVSSKLVADGYCIEVNAEIILERGIHGHGPDDTDDTTKVISNQIKTERIFHVSTLRILLLEEIEEMIKRVSGWDDI